MTSLKGIRPPLLMKGGEGKRREEEDDVKKFWVDRGRGGKEAREDEKQVQTNGKELTVGLGKGKIWGRNSTIFN